MGKTFNRCSLIFRNYFGSSVENLPLFFSLLPFKKPRGIPKKCLCKLILFERAGARFRARWEGRRRAGREEEVAEGRQMNIRCSLRRPTCFSPFISSFLASLLSGSFLRMKTFFPFSLNYFPHFSCLSFFFAAKNFSFFYLFLFTAGHDFLCLTRRKAEEGLNASESHVDAVISLCSCRRTKLASPCDFREKFFTRERKRARAASDQHQHHEKRLQKRARLPKLCKLRRKMRKGWSDIGLRSEFNKVQAG